MATKLNVREGNGIERVVEMAADEIWIGRGMDCAVRTDDSLVSRKHAVLRRSAGTFQVEDLRSANGVFVNEVRITTPYTVAAGDTVRCGGLTLRIQAVQVEMAPALAPPPAPAPAPVPETPPPQRMPSMLEQERTLAVAEARALKMDNETIKRRVEELTTALNAAEESYDHEKHLVAELRSELEVARDDIARVAAELALARGDVEKNARRVQLGDTEIARLKDEGDKLRKEIAEMSRIKDEGWKQVNHHVHELEHLREVIKEQGDLLEERRVQLITLESAVARRAAQQS